MQKRIFRVIAATLLIFVAVFALLEFYVTDKVLVGEAENEIKSVAKTITTQDISPEEIYQVCKEQLGFDIRVTYVDKSGNVLFESEATTQMENHISREEVKTAFETGSGEATRNSTTIGKSTYYYALQYQDGVIRFARERDSFMSVVIGIIPIMICIVAAIVVISILASIFISQRLTIPLTRLVNQFDVLDDNKKPLEIETDYEELLPLLENMNSMRERIQVYINELKNAEEVRRDFSANVSHELKTPLTTIKGFGEMLENGLITDENDVKKYGAIINRESARLLSLINEIMRLSEIEESNNQSNIRVNLLDAANDAKQVLLEKSEQAQVDVFVEGQNIEIYGNPVYLNELFLNLMENAIKYNKKGGWVKVEVMGQGANAVIIVKDNGIGIAPENQKRIFERFYRVDKSHSKAIGGTGLGLSIVKHIVTYHRGKIYLKSDVGKGTEFRVEIPTS